MSQTGTDHENTKKKAQTTGCSGNATERHHQPQHVSSCSFRMYTTAPATTALPSRPSPARLAACCRACTRCFPALRCTRTNTTRTARQSSDSAPHAKYVPVRLARINRPAAPLSTPPPTPPRKRRPVYFHTHSRTRGETHATRRRATRCCTQCAAVALASGPSTDLLFDGKLTGRGKNRPGRSEHGKSDRGQRWV